MTKLLLILPVLFAFSLSSPGPRELTLEGRWIDGDTFLSNIGPIRLVNIDSLEKDQSPYQFEKDYPLKIKFLIGKRDRYDRILGTLSPHGNPSTQTILLKGQAIFYSSDLTPLWRQKTLYQWQQKAMLTGEGIFSQKKFKNPVFFRRLKRKSKLHQKNKRDQTNPFP